MTDIEKMARESDERAAFEAWMLADKTRAAAMLRYSREPSPMEALAWSAWQARGAFDSHSNVTDTEFTAKRCAQICHDVAHEYWDTPDCGQVIATAGLCRSKILRDFGIKEEP